MKTMHLLFVIILYLVKPYNSIADVTRNYPIEITHNRPVYFTLANSAINRVSFSNFKVMKLIGNIGNFDSVFSDNGSHLFITPKIPEGTIHFTALLSNEKIIDFALGVIPGKRPKLVELKLVQQENQSKESEELKLIKAMHLGIDDKYYVQQVSKKINLSLDAKIKLEAKNMYRWQNLYGMSLVVKNVIGQEIKINPDDLAANFQNVALVYIKNELLAPGAETNAYIVLRKEQGE